MNPTTTPTTAERIIGQLGKVWIIDQSLQAKGIKVIAAELERERQQVGDLLRSALDDHCKYPQMRLHSMQRDRIEQALALLAEPQPGKEGK